MMFRSPRARALAAVSAALLLAGLGLWLFSSSSSESPEPPVSTRPPRATRSPAPAFAALPDVPPPAPAAPELPTPERLQRALDDYRESARFPPGSRPFEEGARYKLDWNASLKDDLPFESLADGGIEGDLSYRLETDRAHVSPGEALTTRLFIYRGQADQPVALRIHSAAVVSGGAQQTPLLPLTFQADARSGNGVYSNRFVPSESEALRRAEEDGERDFSVALDVEAEGRRLSIRRAFTFTTREPLKLLGSRDALLDGSLVVTLTFQVETAGLYTFEANLLSASTQQPLGWIHTSESLPQGRAEVQLPFFGKVLHDAAVDGPYLVTGLRAFLRNAQGAPTRFWVSASPLRTSYYAARGFSAAEWNSPEKEARLRVLQQVVDSAKAPPPAPTGQPSPHLHIGEDGVPRPVP